jgi:hypothetical protein
MGRGRAKAKQTKVARELKYSSGGTDLDRLRAELTGLPGTAASQPAGEAEDEDEDEGEPKDDLDLDEDEA